MITRTRKLAVGAFVVAGLLLALLARPPVASAHARLLDTEPTKGGTVTSPTTKVQLTFNQEMQEKFAAVAVTGPDGGKIATGKPEVTGKKVEQRIKPFDEAGKYRVGWRAVSADGHPVSGRFSFTVRDSAVPATETPKPTPTSSSPAARQTGDGDDRSFLERHALHLLLAALVILVGLAVVVWDRRRRHD